MFDDVFSEELVVNIGFDIEPLEYYINMQTQTDKKSLSIDFI